MINGMEILKQRKNKGVLQMKNYYIRFVLCYPFCYSIK